MHERTTARKDITAVREGVRKGRLYEKLIN